LLASLKNHIGNKETVMFLNKKAIALIILIAILSAATTAAGAVTVGVTPGDWIEYQVTFTGTPPDPSHSITAARMEVMTVQGDVINVTIVSTYTNGTQATTSSTLNLDTGELIDNFIIPAGLTSGSEFSSTMGNMGKMMIGGSTQGSYCGATRTVVTATSGNNRYTWDQATGVSVEGTTTEPTYTMHSLATSTNMWSSQTASPGSPDMTLVYAAVIAIVVIVVVAAVAVLALSRRKK
jgi:hypothetical protein